MQESWTEKLKAFNADWNDLPRRMVWILALLACLFLTLFVFPYIAPFALATIFAWIIDPLVRFFTKKLGNKKWVHNLFSAIFVVLITTLLLSILMLLLGRIFEEVKVLVAALPEWISNASTQVIDWIESIDIDWAFLESGALEDILMRFVSDATSALTSLATRLASTVARGAWRTAAMLPQIILFIVLTLMGTFYMSSDKERILGFLRSLLPEKHRQRSSVFRTSILRAILVQFRSALIMLCVTFTELSLGFLLMGLDYAILLALVIALLDALPVIGAGLFLIPMCIWGIVSGNILLAVGSGLVYLMTIIVRQFLEPRIIGKHLGLHPLATMMAMYAGLHAMGFLGMILGPLMLLLCKVALTADSPMQDEPAPKPTKSFGKPKKKF